MPLVSVPLTSHGRQAATVHTNEHLPGTRGDRGGTVCSWAAGGVSGFKTGGHLSKNPGKTFVFHSHVMSIYLHSFNFLLRKKNLFLFYFILSRSLVTYSKLV